MFSSGYIPRSRITGSYGSSIFNDKPSEYFKVAFLLLLFIKRVFCYIYCFPDSSVDRKSTCNAGDPSLICGLGRFAGEVIGYPLQYSWASLVVQLPLAMWETWVWSLDCKDSRRRGRLPTPVFWPGEFHGLSSPWGHRDRYNWTTFTFTSENRGMRWWWVSALDEWKVLGLWQVYVLSSVQSLSHIWLFATPWTAACQASLSITNSWSLFKLMSIEFVMPSNHLILCHPLLLLPSIFPSIRVFSNELVLHIRWPKYWSFSFSISPFNEYSGLISFRID